MKDVVEVKLKEYMTLRQESLDAIKNRITILSLGLTAISALFAGSILTLNSENLFPSILMLLLVIPILSWLIFLILLGEFQRMKRLGEYLITIEKYINDKLSDTVLNWEIYLKENDLHMRYPYVAGFGLLMLVSISAQSLGIYFLDNSLISKIAFEVIILLFHILVPTYIVLKILNK